MSEHDSEDFTVATVYGVGTIYRILTEGPLDECRVTITSGPATMPVHGTYAFVDAMRYVAEAVQAEVDAEVG